MDVTIAIVLIEQCMASAIAGSIDMLHVANRVTQALGRDDLPVFHWQLVSVSGRPVRTGNGSVQAADTSLEGLKKADIIYIPGMSIIDEAELLGVLDNNQSLVSWLAERAASGCLMTSSCTGSFFLAESGLLDGKAATTGWPVAQLFTSRYPNIRLQDDQMLVDGQSVICAGASTSYQDLMLEIIKRFSSSRVAHLTARYLLLDVNRKSQSAYKVARHQKYDDPLINKAHVLLLRHLNKPLQVPEMASSLNVSDRTLIRRFNKATGHGPNTHLQNLRIDRAKWMLETSRKSHEQVANSVGYSDICSFRRLFKRSLGMTMGDYRKRFTDRPLKGQD